MTTRRWRLDDRRCPPSSGAPAGSRTVSGRRTVVALVLATLVLWFGLDRAFRRWKARHEARASFGATHVAPAVDPLAALVPPDIPPDDWRRAVADTRAMLVALSGSGVLDLAQMEALRRAIADRVARSRPETVRADLSALWDDLERRAGPVIAPDLAPPPAGSRQAQRHPRPPRPKLLGPSPLRSLERPR